MAIGSMTTNSTVDIIDKTLTIENAPADAKATGDALAGKLGLHGTADNSAKWGDYERRFNEVTGSTHVLVETDGKYVDLRPAESIGLTAFAASGAGYVRFGDGTQICWGDTPAYPVIPPRTTYYVRVNFAAPFNNMAYSITADPVYDGGNTWVLHTFSLGRATSYATIGLANGSTTDTVNAGTIYSYIAIGTWK